MSQPSFRTRRLLVRPFASEDCHDLHGILSDPEPMRYWDNVHADLDETRAFVNGTIAGAPETTCDFVLEHEGHVIGKAGMWSAPEIGFILAQAYWRQGLMSEALEVIIPHLFATYTFPTLTADVDPENAGSLALMQGFGFKETGRAQNTIKIAGKWCDSVYLALSREDWAARTG